MKKIKAGNMYYRIKSAGIINGKQMCVWQFRPVWWPFYSDHWGLYSKEFIERQIKEKIDNLKVTSETLDINID